MQHSRGLPGRRARFIRLVDGVLEFYGCENVLHTATVAAVLCRAMVWWRWCGGVSGVAMVWQRGCGGADLGDGRVVIVLWVEAILTEKTILMGYMFFFFLLSYYELFFFLFFFSSLLLYRE